MWSCATAVLVSESLGLWIMARVGGCGVRWSALVRIGTRLGRMRVKERRVEKMEGFVVCTDGMNGCWDDVRGVKGYSKVSIWNWCGAVGGVTVAGEITPGS
eukprot:GFKZ01004387.1.p1 GENE.GFKZ01004387.1~~GFKZ01004387.1.p1  ORF type:complete len:101 (+),score=11.21 GFKZ01004387.1:616-918(+)